MGQLTLAGEEKVSEVEKAEAEKEARMWLEVLRSGSAYHENHVDWLRKMLKCAELQLEDIGSSEREFWEFRAKGGKASALHHLNYLRTYCLDHDFITDERQLCRDKIKQGLKLAGLTPADIGATEDELAGL